MAVGRRRRRGVYFGTQRRVSSLWLRSHAGHLNDGRRRCLGPAVLICSGPSNAPAWCWNSMVGLMAPSRKAKPPRARRPPRSHSSTGRQLWMRAIISWIPPPTKPPRWHEECVAPQHEHDRATPPHAEPKVQESRPRMARWHHQQIRQEEPHPSESGGGVNEAPMARSAALIRARGLFATHWGVQTPLFLFLFSSFDSVHRNHRPGQDSAFKPFVYLARWRGAFALGNGAMTKPSTLAAIIHQISAAKRLWHPDLGRMRLAHSVQHHHRQFSGRPKRSEWTQGGGRRQRVGNSPHRWRPIDSLAWATTKSRPMN